MFTTNTKFDIWSGRAATRDPHLDKKTDARTVNRDKRIDRINFSISVMMQE